MSADTMVPSPADVSLPDSLKDQPFQSDIVVRPDSDGKYQCRRCPKRFPCHEPYQYHATKHGDTVKHIYIGTKQMNSLKPDIRAYHGVYCDRSTHYVRVTVSQLFGSTSSIQQIDKEVVLTFGQFHEKEFSPTETYKDILKRMEELDGRCCRRIHDTTVFGSKTFLKLLRLCFSCVPTLRQFRSSRWPSTPDPRATPLYPSTEATTADDAHLPDPDNLISVSSQPVSCQSPGCGQDSATSAYSHPSSPALSQTALVQAAPTYAAPGQLLTLPPFQASALPENVIGIIAVDSFHSTPNGVHGNVLVATQSDTVKLLEGVHFGALLPHARIASQLLEIVGEPSFERLLEFENMREEIWFPIYSGILPDDCLTEVGKELRLEDCSPMLQAQVYNSLGI